MASALPPIATKLVWATTPLRANNGPRHAQKQRAIWSSDYRDVGHRPAYCGVIASFHCRRLDPVGAGLDGNLEGGNSYPRSEGRRLAWPLAARAQQPAMPVIGFVNAAFPQGYARQVSAFLAGLGEAGYVDGHNVVIEYRWAEGQNDRLPAMAADLVHREVAVIAATSTPAALAAKAATTTIPIVFESGADPVQLGLVPNLNRPGGNVTGVTQRNQEIVPKRLELLHELLPAASVMALLVNPTDPGLAEPTTKDRQTAARTLGLQLHVLNASTERDFDGSSQT